MMFRRLARSAHQAIGSPTLKVRFPDGREVTYRFMDELRKAKAEIEEDIRRASGQIGSRVVRILLTWYRGIRRCRRRRDFRLWQPCVCCL